LLHPPERQTELVRALRVAAENDGFVQVDPMRRETAVVGIYAQGDLTTLMQGALLAAASGRQAATFINFELTVELASTGGL